MAENEAPAERTGNAANSGNAWKNEAVREVRRHNAAEQPRTLTGRFSRKV